MTVAVITDHTFEPLEQLDWPRCSHIEVRDGTGRVCDRPADEHTLTPEIHGSQA